MKSGVISLGSMLAIIDTGACFLSLVQLGSEKLFEYNQEFFFLARLD
jgi:hypothetical protein